MFDLGEGYFCPHLVQVSQSTTPAVKATASTHEEQVYIIKIIDT